MVIGELITGICCLFHSREYGQQNSQGAYLINAELIELEPEQEELLAKLVEAEKTLPREKRQEFIYYNFKPVTVALTNHDNWGMTTQVTINETPQQVVFSANGLAKLSLGIGTFLHGIPGFQIPKPEDEARVLALKNSVAPVELVPPETSCGVIFHPQIKMFFEVLASDIDFLRETGLLRFSSQEEFSVSGEGLSYYKKMQGKFEQNVHKPLRNSNMTRQENIQVDNDANDAQFRVFISHSSHDKPFVHRLAADLKNQDLDIWVDEQELQVGDSIVQGISSGLKGH